MATVKGLSTYTINTLRSISAAILANPKAYTQDDFVEEFETENERGCIAFFHSKLVATARTLKLRITKHAAWFEQIRSLTSHVGMVDNPFYIAAKKDLKLTDEQAKRLIGEVSYWPNKFFDGYVNAKTPKGRARALYNRIEFFIATNGTDVKPARKTSAIEDPC